jgi:threonyl-tRNA synthetase
VQVLDNAGREFTLSTVQVDFYQPQRFELEYVGADGAKHRPVMVHRSIVGSVERAVAHLIEQHGGAFPAWLAPVQAVLLPLTDDELPAAEAFRRRCVDAGLRAELHAAERGSLGARIREARLVPFQAVIGPREVAAEAVALRLRDGQRLAAERAEAALDRMLDGIAASQGPKSPAPLVAAGAAAAAAESVPQAS